MTEPAKPPAFEGIEWSRSDEEPSTFFYTPGDQSITILMRNAEVLMHCGREIGIYH